MSDAEPVVPLGHNGRAGDPSTADVIFARYARRLARLAERHLNRRVAARVDGEDVVQSVFRTFFRRSARGDFQIDSTAQLWRLLVTITIRKARTKARHHGAAARDVRSEHPTGGGDDLAWLGKHDPGPDEGVTLVELTAALLRNLPPWYARLLELRLEGWPVARIAAELGVSRQTVYRGLDVFQGRLKDQGLMGEDDLRGGDVTDRPPGAMG
jgi:RNA polymerase sigma-70 factor (ECF subfamily)